MDENPSSSAEEMRMVAAHWRKMSEETELPNYKTMMLRMAEEVEQIAENLSASAHDLSQ